MAFLAVEYQTPLRVYIHYKNSAIKGMTKPAWVQALVVNNFAYFVF